MSEPVWLEKPFILALHEELLAKFGGADGIRDEGMLESALSRPQNLFAYEAATIFELAASYTYGIVGNHPFIDGNKRTGFMTAYVFLGQNNWQLEAGEAEATAATLNLASKKLTQAEYALWLEANCRRIRD